MFSIVKALSENVKHHTLQSPQASSSFIFNGTGIIGVCLKKNQFYALTGTSATTSEARTAKAITLSQWNYATILACTLYVTTTNLTDLINKPDGIGAQCWFASYGNFTANMSSTNPIKYAGVSVWDVCIAGNGIYTTVSQVKKASGSNRNVFYSRSV